MEAGKQQRQLPFHVLSWNGEKGRVLAEEMSAYNGYETSSGIGYPTPGSFGSYIEAKGIAMVTLEMPVADAAACWTHHRAARGNSPSLGSVHPERAWKMTSDFQEDEPESEVRHDLIVGKVLPVLGRFLPPRANS